MLEVAALVDDAAEQTAITDALLAPTSGTTFLPGQSALLVLKLALHLVKKAGRKDFDGLATPRHQRGELADSPV